MVEVVPMLLSFRFNFFLWVHHGPFSGIKIIAFLDIPLSSLSNPLLIYQLQMLNPKYLLYVSYGGKSSMRLVATV